ncbi:hypothetical protein FACS189446_0660 [Bacteroidia bacterium]|nr:hypothetical protein FACS189446_0660 [Bacteroidia bacterium]
MEKHCYELVTGMEERCKTHRLVYDNQTGRLFFFLSLSRKIKQLCKNNTRINVIYFNDALIACFCSFLKLPEQASCMVTLHGLDVIFPSHTYHKYIFNRLNTYDCLIAVSEATAKKAKALGVDPQKVVVVPNGVHPVSSVQDTPDVDFQNWLSLKQIDLSGRKLLMMMGRPVFRKGFSWFAGNVFPRLQEPFYLVIVGPFHRMATLLEKFIYLIPKSLRYKVMLFCGYFSDERQLRKIIGQSSHIKHLEHLPYPEVERLFNKVDAFLMPNIPVEGDMEGFGLVCLEASAQGALVFASAIDGIPDAIKNERNGFLLPAEDIEAWTDKLNDFARNTDFYKQYKVPFRQYTLANYSWRQMVDAYYQIFERYAKRGNRKD